MSYSDLRDFSHEAAYRFGNENGRYVVEIEKLGGGVVGRDYDGKWRYIVRHVADWNGSEYVPVEPHEIARGQDFESPMPLSHRRAALVIWEMVLTEA